MKPLLTSALTDLDSAAIALRGLSNGLQPAGGVPTAACPLQPVHAALTAIARAVAKLQAIAHQPMIDG
jgi:hypothetical protein